MSVTIEQLNVILNQLQQLENAVESDTVAADVSKVRRKLKKWDGQGEIPYLDQLRAWNIELPDSQNAGPWGISGVRLPEPDSALSSNLTPKQEYELLAAAKLADERNFPAALDILGRLELEAPENPKLRSWKLEIQNRYNLGTLSLIKAAEQRTHVLPEDYEEQRKCWVEVLNFHPGDEVASARLQQIQDLVDQRATREKVLSLRDEADLAFGQRDLPALQEIYGKIEALRGYKDPSGELQRSVSELHTYVKLLRDRLTAASGLTVSILMQADRDSYIKLKDAVAAGKKTVTDDTGKYGNLNEEVNIRVVYEDMRKDYVKELDNLASGRIREAHGSAGSKNDIYAIQKARRLLEEALGALNDEILDQGDRTSLSGMRSQVESELEKINTQIQQYNQVDEAIRAADSEHQTLQERLKLLKDARKTYPAHPQLEPAINDVVGLIIAEANRAVKRAVLDADFAADQEDFGTALSSLADCRESVGKALAPKELSEAKTVITADVDSASDRIRRRQSAYDRMVTAADNCRTALAAYKSSKDEADLRAAQGYIEGIAPEFRDHLLVQAVQREYARNQADPVKWEKGNELYKKGQWVEAENNFAEIGHDFAQFEQAHVLLRRAQAAQKFEKGLVAYGQKEWLKARDYYVSSLCDFEGDELKGLKGVGADEWTLSVVRRCRAELENLRPIAEGEEKIALLINKATEELESARRASHARSLPADKVDVQPAYQKTADALMKARAEAMSRADDLTLLLSQVRQEWRNTYLEGMNTALRASDVGLMQKALVQAEELERFGLLNDEDKRLRYTIQAEMLDIEVQQWLPDGEQFALNAVDWGKVENNRRQRYDVEIRLGYMQVRNSPAWDASESKKSALRKGISSITNRRIHIEVTEKLESNLRNLKANLQKDGKGPDAASRRARLDIFREAATFLGVQMRDNPVLRDDIELMKQWIQLAWAANDWLYADEIARKFIEYGVYTDGRHLDEFFHTLTQAARSFAENNIQRAEAYLKQLNDQDKDWTAANTDLLAEQKKYLLQEVKTRLLQEAQDDLEQRIPQGYLTAAQKYALLYQLDSQNIIVRQGLEECGRHIQTGLVPLFTRAERIRLGNRSLDDAIKDAEDIEMELKGINSVAAPLGLGRELQIRLDDALLKVITYKAKWTSVHEQIAKHEKELSNAMSSPRALEENGKGGWEFDAVAEAIEGARKEAGTDRDLLDHVSVLEKEMEKLQQMADRLNQLARTMMDAVFTEDFENVIKHAQTLDNTWTDARSKDGRWDGLRYLIREDYPQPLKQPTLPRHHVENAIQQNDNLQEWREWADGTGKMYESLRNVRRDFQRPLEDWKQDSSLQSIITECDRTMAAIDRLQERFNDKPATPPLSDKARQENDRVNASLLSSLQTSRVQIRRLKKDAIEEKDRLSEHLTRLLDYRQLLQGLEKAPANNKRNARVNPSQIANAQKVLERCQEIDPQNDQVREIRIYLETLKRRQLP